MAKAILCLNLVHRLEDNPLFIYCAKNNLEALPIIFFQESVLSNLGAVEKLALHESLKAFEKQLDKKLIYISSEEELEQLVNLEKPSHFLYNFTVDPRFNYDYEELALDFPEINFVQVFASNIFNFDKIQNKSGKVFKVFTPFYKNCLTRVNEFIVDQLKDQLSTDIKAHVKIKKSKFTSSLDKFALLGSNAKWNQAWQKKVMQYWQVSQEQSLLALHDFIDVKVTEYALQRDFPSVAATSKQSLFLHLGVISPFRIWFDVEQEKIKTKNASEKYEPFLRQLCWREFAMYILYHFPSSNSKNLDERFNKFSWKKNKAFLTAWQKGLTGFPIVDAGMRELWETGWMHNRVRMIVGSFLVKDLMITWQEGAAWFKDTLIDMDEANNSMGWQWVAGSGVDASPYFRIFNPMTQSEKFDKNADYIRKWIPELAKLDNKWIHRPFDAPELILKSANIELGKDYPKPLVNHDMARKEALEAFKALKN